MELEEEEEGENDWTKRGGKGCGVSQLAPRTGPIPATPVVITNGINIGGGSRGPTPSILIDEAEIDIRKVCKVNK